MIITVTPNPGIDRTITIPSFVRGTVMRATESREDSGGKGLNVSRALTLNGTPTTAVLPIGGVYGGVMLDLLREQRIDVVPVPISGSIRVNVAIVEPDGTTSKINEQGPSITPAEADALRLATLESSAGAEWVVCCGSLPPGIGDDFFAAIVKRCRADGTLVAVDSSGEPMARALAVGPDLVKPNRVELAEAVGRDLPTVGAVVTAALGVVASGVRTVLVSLGRDGALLIEDDRTVHASASAVSPVSTVGAGDALLAGYLHAVCAGADAATALATAVAFGAAAVGLPGSQMPSPDDVAAIRVTLDESPDPDRRLDD